MKFSLGEVTFERLPAVGFKMDKEMRDMIERFLENHQTFTIGEMRRIEKYRGMLPSWEIESAASRVNSSRERFKEIGDSASIIDNVSEWILKDKCILYICTYDVCTRTTARFSSVCSMLRERRTEIRIYEVSEQMWKNITSTGEYDTWEKKWEHLNTDGIAVNPSSWTVPIASAILFS